MSLTTLSNLADIEAYLQNHIKSVLPDVNVMPGYPLYDLLIKSSAEIIYKERNYVNVINNISKLTNLFDTAGNLLYPQYRDLLLNKYFIGSEEIDAVVYSIDLVFNQACSLGLTIFFISIKFLYTNK